MIDLQAHRIGEMYDENQRLNEALVTLREENLKSTGREMTYGALGIVVGVVATLLVVKK